MTRPTYEPRFTLGNVITIGVFIAQAVLGYAWLQASVSSVKEMDIDQNISISKALQKANEFDVFVGQGPRFTQQDARTLKSETLSEARQHADSNDEKIKNKLDEINKNITDVKVLLAKLSARPNP